MDKTKIVIALQDISFAPYLKEDIPLDVLYHIFEQRLDAFNELRKLPDCSQCPGLGWLISHQINESLPRYEIVPWEPDDTFTLDEMDGDV